MSLELVKKLIDVTELSSKETSQIVKERDIIVPDGKPDVQKVLYLDGKVRMDQVEIQQNRIVYKGQVEVTILYTPESATAGISKMKGSIPLDDFIIVDGIDADQRIDFTYDIEHMHWNVLNERKINVKSIIQLSVSATRLKEVAMVSDVETDAPVQKKTRLVDIINMLPVKEEKIIVKDELSVPQGKSPIGDILKIMTSISEDQIKRTNEELIFNGMVEVSTLYQASDDVNDLTVISHKIPFAGSVDLMKMEDEMYWDCNLEVVPTYVQVNPDYDGEDRIIEVECIITARYTTYNSEKNEVVDDIYCPGKKVEKKDKIEKYMNLIFKENISSPKKEVITVDGLDPDIHQVYSVEITPTIDEKEFVNDKLTIEGTLEINILYTDTESNNKIVNYIDVIPFQTDVTPNCDETKVNVDVKVLPKDIQVLGVNRESLSLEYVLDYIINIYQTEQLNVIEEIEFSDISKEDLAAYPSITVYTVKAGENLWDIAKKFNTTVADIVEVNEIDENYQLHPGEKIIVIKRSKF
ncbi:MAG: hypothetical protein ATN36_01615 [Epulopiscium sp. Nele67-Bin005]|nr:MAG: hypothetical protein ATN36_01615 [Epulopiscium sp. Nele67-Bin005]